MRGKAKKINYKLMKRLIFNSDLPSAKIGERVSCSENTVRVYAREWGSTRFKQRVTTHRVQRNHTDKGSYNYLADMKAGFPRKVKPLEGYSGIVRQLDVEIL